MRQLVFLAAALLLIGASSSAADRVLLGGNSYWLSVRLTRDGRVAQIYWW